MQPAKNEIDDLQISSCCRQCAHTRGTAGQRQKIDVAKGVMLSQRVGTNCPSFLRPWNNVSPPRQTCRCRVARPARAWLYVPAGPIAAIPISRCQTAQNVAHIV